MPTCINENQKTLLWNKDLNRTLCAQGADHVCKYQHFSEISEIPLRPSKPLNRLSKFSVIAVQCYLGKCSVCTVSS